MTLRERLAQLEKLQPRIAAGIDSLASAATVRAAEKAAALTPPVGGDLKGTHTRAGTMKQHWMSDSVCSPVRQGHAVITVLANNQRYASYVNDGHRMDRHFVPGLYINPYSGQLEYDPSEKAGLVVGTRTAYVPGLHMTDAARREYRRALRKGMREIKELLR